MMFHSPQVDSLKTPDMVKICPKCASTHVNWVAGGIIGAVYRCDQCGYEGTFVLEVRPRDLERFRKELNSDQGGK